MIDAGEGAFVFGRQDYGGGDCDTIMIRVPYSAKHDSIHTLRIYRTGDPKPLEPAWTWDGNLEAPTLQPSIACGLPKGSDSEGRAVWIEQLVTVDCYEHTADDRRGQHGSDQTFSVGV